MILLCTLGGGVIRIEPVIGVQTDCNDYNDYNDYRC